MDFSDVFIVLFGLKIYEPLVLVTNSIFFVLCVFYFNHLKRFEHSYAKQMAWFMLLLGSSSMFGAVGHAVHLQLGEPFFKIILFLMNALSLFSMYFFFRSAYTFTNVNKEPSKTYIYLVMAWVFVLLVVSGICGNFMLIKIHAAIVLLYSMIAHYLVHRRTDEKGSRIVILGIVISILAFIVHGLKISVAEWFNYKDISHVIMIISMIVIYKGARTASETLQHAGVNV